MKSENFGKQTKKWFNVLSDERGATEEGHNQRRILNSSSHPAVFKDNF